MGVFDVPLNNFNILYFGNMDSSLSKEFSLETASYFGVLNIIINSTHMSRVYVYIFLGLEGK